MSSGKSNKSSNKSAAAAASQQKSATTTAPEQSPANGTSPAVSATATAAAASKRGPRVFNRYVLALGSVMLVLLASRISITPGHSSEDKDETISVGESDVTAVYRDDPFGTRVPVDSIVTILGQVSLFFERTLNPELSLVSWVFNREAGRLNRTLTDIATKMKQDWTEGIVKTEMMEKTRAVLDTLIATIDIESVDNGQHQYSHNANISPRALASELGLLIKIISETLTGSKTSEQQTPSLRTANYIDYMKIKVDKVPLPDIIREYLVLFKRIGYEKVLTGLREMLREWRKEFKPE